LALLLLAGSIVALELPDVSVWPREPVLLREWAFIAAAYDAASDVADA